LVLTTWKAQLIDVKEAYLKGCFTDSENLYLDIPQGFEKFYKKDKELHLNPTIYGLKQAALASWKEFLQAFKNMGFRRSPADPCLYIKNTSYGLVIWTSWVDNCLILGHQEDLTQYHKMMNNYFDCNNIGELKE
jgi:hypothetical protein